MLLEANSNLLVQQWGNCLMFSAVLLQLSSVGLCLLDYLQNGVNPRNQLLAVFCWGCMTSVAGVGGCPWLATANFGCFCARLTELENFLACWRLAALICLFSKQNGCWLLLQFFECLRCLLSYQGISRSLFFPSGAFMYHTSVFTRQLPFLIARKKFYGESGCFISSGRWSHKSL